MGDPFRSTPRGMGEATSPIPNTSSCDKPRKSMDTGKIANDGYSVLDRADGYGDRRGLSGPDYMSGPRY